MDVLKEPCEGGRGSMSGSQGLQVIYTTIWTKLDKITNTAPLPLFTSLITECRVNDWFCANSQLYIYWEMFQIVFIFLLLWICVIGSLQLSCNLF